MISFRAKKIGGEFKSHPLITFINTIDLNLTVLRFSKVYLTRKILFGHIRLNLRQVPLFHWWWSSDGDNSSYSISGVGLVNWADCLLRTLESKIQFLYSLRTLRTDYFLPKFTAVIYMNFFSED